MIIYSKKLPVIIYQSGDERKVELLFKIELKDNAKDLAIQLSNDLDYSFLYYVNINQEDYSSLKSTQKLVSDFGAFPKDVIDYLDSCGGEAGKDDNNFLLHLSLGPSKEEAKLSVVKVLKLKHYIPLELDLCQGSDANFRSYLLNEMTSFKTLSHQLKEKYEATKANLEKSEAELNNQIKVVKNQLANQQVLFNDLKKDWEMQVEELKKKQRKEMQNKEEETEVIIEELKKQHNSILHNSNQQLQLLQSQLKTLAEKNSALQTQLSETQSSLSSQRSETEQTQQTFQQLKQQLSKTESTLAEREKSVAELMTRLGVSEDKRSEGDLKMKELNAQIESLKEENARQNAELLEKRKEAQKASSAVKKLVAEVHKGNQAISKLKEDVKNQQFKAKQRGLISIEQEKALEAKKNEVAELKSTIESLQDDLGKAQNAVSSSAEQIKLLNGKLMQANKSIKTNENVISWLSKKIDDSQFKKLPSSEVIVSAETNQTSDNHDSSQTPSDGILDQKYLQCSNDDSFSESQPRTHQVSFQHPLTPPQPQQYPLPISQQRLPNATQKPQTFQQLNQKLQQLNQRLPLHQLMLRQQYNDIVSGNSNVNNCYKHTSTPYNDYTNFNKTLNNKNFKENLGDRLTVSNTK